MADYEQSSPQGETKLITSNTDVGCSTKSFKASHCWQTPMSKSNQVKNLGGLRFHDTQTGMPFGIPKGARCVQRFDDSLNSAIHITYRISLRSSSMPEPRDPLLKVLMISNLTQTHYSGRVLGCVGGRGPGGRSPPATGARPQWARRGNAVTVNTGGRLGS